MFAQAQAPPDHAHRFRTQRNRRTSFCCRRSRCGADLIAAVGDRWPVGATADGSRADDGRCCIPASGSLAGPAADVVLQWKAHIRTLAAPSQLLCTSGQVPAITKTPTVLTPVSR